MPPELWSSILDFIRLENKFYFIIYIYIYTKYIYELLKISNSRKKYQECFMHATIICVDC